MHATNLLRFPILLVGYFLLLYSLKSVDVRIVESCGGSTNRFKDGNTPDLGIGIVTMVDLRISDTFEYYREV